MYYDTQSIFHHPKKQLAIIILAVISLYIIFLWLQGRSDAQDMFIQGDVAYVAWGSAGLGVLNIQDPIMPSPIAFFDTFGDTKNIAFNAPYLYIADAQDGVHIFDVSKPSDPLEIGVIRAEAKEKSFLRLKAHSPAHQVVLYNPNTAIIAFDDLGIGIADISIPHAPILQKMLKIEGSAQRITVNGNLAYIAAAKNGIVIIDLSSPYTPQIINTYKTSAYAYDVAVTNLQEKTIAVIADGNRGIQIIDVSDPSNIIHISTLQIPGTARIIKLEGNLAYIASGEGGLRIVDLSNIKTPREIGSFESNGYTYNIFISHPFAYILDGKQAIQILQIQDVKNLRKISNYDFPGKPNALQHGAALTAFLLALFIWSFVFSQFCLPVNSFNDRLEANRHFWLYWLGLHGPATFVEKGQTIDRPITHTHITDTVMNVIKFLKTITWPFSWIIEKLLDSILGIGSGVILFDAASAGVLRNPFQFTRPVGPGIVFTKKFEGIAGTVDLRTQTQFIGPRPGEDCFSFQYEDETESMFITRKNACLTTSATTRDGIEIVANVIAIFRLSSKPGAGGTPYGFRRGAVWQAIVHEGINSNDSQDTGTSWNEIPAFIAIDLWREYLRKYTLNELFEPIILCPDGIKRTALEVTINEVRTRMTKSHTILLSPNGRYTSQTIPSPQYQLMKQRGLDILTIVITNIRMPNPVDLQITQRWKNKWELKLVHQQNLIQIDRKDSSDGLTIARKEYAIWSSRPLYKYLENKNTFPDLTQTLSLLLEGSIEKTQVDRELQRRLGDNKVSLMEVYEWVRSH